MKKIFKTTFAVLILLVSVHCNNTRMAPYKMKIGVQTWSFRTMEDQSPLAILSYVKKSGVQYVELMGNHAEPFAGAPKNPMSDTTYRPILYKRYRKEVLTEEEQVLAAAFDQKMAAFRKDKAAWYKTVDYSLFDSLKNLYAAEGIKIFAFKPRVFGKENSDAVIRYGMQAALALGADHVTLEHPEDDAHTQRLASLAEEVGIDVAYHGHEQQTPVLWDTAITQSKRNKMNLDFGHYIAAENENAVNFIAEKGAFMASMHLKDRQKKSNGGGNLAWGQGDTPIGDVVRMIAKNKYEFPVTIEVEYDIPEGSDPVAEVKKCKAYIEKALSN